MSDPTALPAADAPEPSRPPAIRTARGFAAQSGSDAEISASLSKDRIANGPHLDQHLPQRYGELVMALCDFSTQSTPHTLDAFRALEAQSMATGEAETLVFARYGIACALRTLGQTRQGYEFALQRLLPILPARPSLGSVHAHNAAGVMAQHLGMAAAACDHFYAALGTARELALTERVAQINCNLGELYLTCGNLEEAEALLRESLTLAVDSEARGLKPFATLMLALCLFIQKRYADALHVIEPYIGDDMSHLCAQPATQAFLQSVAALVLAQGERLDLAETFCQMALTTLNGVEDPHFKPHTWWASGHIHYRCGRLESAISDLERAVAHLDAESLLPVPLHALETLAEIHAARGTWQDSTFAHQRHHVLFARLQDRAIRIHLRERNLESRYRVAQAAREQAEERARAKSQFLANMTHQIRTPANTIVGLAHLTLENRLDPRQRHHVEKIQESGLALLGTINEMLDVARLEDGRLDVERVGFDLAAVLSHVSTTAHAHAAEKGLRYRLQVPERMPTRLIGDPLRLGQVLVSLLNNAVQYTETGEIILSIQVIPPCDDTCTLEFSIRDTGIGMDLAQTMTLFDSLNKADDPTSRRPGGAGLGLSISYRLIRLMGGELWFESKPGVGSTFYFTLTLNPDVALSGVFSAAASAAPAASTPETPARQTNSPETPPATCPIQFDQGLSRAAQDAGLYLDLLHQFRNEYQVWSTTPESLPDTPEAARSRLQRLASFARLIGARALAERAQQTLAWLDAPGTLIDSHPGAAPAWPAQWLQLCTTVAETVQAVPDTLPHTPPDPALLQTLLRLMQEQDGDTLEFAEQHRSALALHCSADTINRVISRLRQYDYEEALALLRPEGQITALLLPESQRNNTAQGNAA